jgi:hypothetical protein
MKKQFSILFILSHMLIGQSAPTTPTLYATVDHERVYLAWNNAAEQSIDSLTGYADFEGYRIYRSTDNGVTWGGAHDRLYDHNGNFIGWKPFAQFDLDEDEDEDFCVYGDDCETNSTPTRDEEISGLDPLNTRINLGDNTGLTHSYVDSNVIDGMEYTYIITAYDVGLRTYDIEYTDDDGDGIFTADTSWSLSNPDRITVAGKGLPSLESEFGSSVLDDNYVKVTPGYYASNVWFPDQDNIDTLFVTQSGTIGTGDKSYAVVDRYELTDELLKFEIQAGIAVDAVENMACENPQIYVYEIDHETSQLPVSIAAEYNTSELTQSQIDSLNDLPGSSENGGVFYIPEYKMIADVDEISDKMSGIQFEFENMPKVAQDNVLVDEYYWSTDSTYYTKPLTGLFLYPDFEYSNQSTYDRRLNFDYLIEFFDTPRGDTVTNVYCNTFPTVLPYRITNLTTGKKVSLTHKDLGVLGVLPPDYDMGAFDCAWTRNEEIKFWGDTLQTADGQEEVFTFTLKINIPFYEFIGDSLAWTETGTYDTLTIVHHKAMLWQAQTDIVFDEPSAEYYDDDGDGVNDNPWVPYYPWNDGDSLIIRTEKFYVDGDSWVVDMSLLGKQQDVTETKLDSISVVPNPYMSRSHFQEADERRLRFTRLPSECQIRVYTVTGELVTVIDHSDAYDSNEWWNLRSGKDHDGSEIAPGLYIFVVEAEGIEHIGKFAVVR